MRSEIAHSGSGRARVQRTCRAAVICACVALGVGGRDVAAQQGGGRAGRGQAAAPANPATPRSLSPIDLTGTWVAMVNEDWRWRMMTPAKGDYASVPLTPAAQKAADSWNYAAERGTDDACKPFGVGNIMRMPGRIRISWQDDVTLKLEFDAGTQTRLLYFDGRAATGGPTWQGHSLAAWELAGQGAVDRNGIPTTPAPGGPGFGGGGGRGGARGAAARPRGGSLKVVTSRMRAGHLRKNGVPYSENTSVEEYFDRLTYPNGDVVLVVRTAVTDPTNLTEPFLTSANFKLERDGSKWKPTPCAIDPPVERPK